MPSAGQILASSAQLCQLGADRKPIALGSGCLIRFHGKTLVLTVAHVTGNQGNWAIQLEYMAQGTKCYQIGAMNFISRLTLSDGISARVDFSYAVVPSDLRVYRHFLTPTGETVDKPEVAVYDGPFDLQPSTTDLYSFAGSVMPRLVSNLFNPNRPILDCELASYTGLTYVRSEGDFHVFKLPFSHPGHIFFKGCSGAPILNSAGQPVALVSGAYSADPDEIFGTALNKFMPMLEAIT